MAQVPVAALAGDHPAAAEIEERFQRKEEEVRSRAHDLRLHHYQGAASDVEVWLEAERQLYWAPPCELVEENGGYRVRAAVPGVEVRELQLTALPRAIVLSSNPRGDSPGKERRVHFTEFNGNVLLRRVDLPDDIETGAVKAKLERGILEVTAPRKAAAGANGDSPAGNGGARTKRSTAQPRAAKAAKAAGTGPASTVRRRRAKAASN